MSDDPLHPAAPWAARVAADEATARRLSDTLAESLDEDGAVTSAYEAADGWTVAIHFAEPPNETAIRALVALGSSPALANALIFERIATQDWVKASLEGLAPVRAGRFLVHGSHDRARVPVNRIGIEIEAALAFGTGHHGTTRGCLLALDGLLKRQQVHLSPRAGRGRPSKARSASGAREKSRRGLRILDIGTGSGVLAIAAARALRQRVLASDNDPLAVRVARDNARLNKAGALIDVIHAAGLGARRFRARGPYDIIFVNILLGPLKGLARPIALSLAPGGRVILSGLLATHAQAALSAYRAQGLRLERRIPLQEWMTLVMRR
jgi:ribosomal protein L11 methyltransferase